MPSRRHDPHVDTEHGLPIRHLVQPDQLRALAHPRRVEIMDLLIAEGPLTASQCGTLLGDSAASCSYHLRQLARYGFVVEAEGGRGRNRPWRWTPLGNRIVTGDSPAEQSAAEALAGVLDARNANRIRRYLEQRSTDPWRESAGLTDWAIRMTEDELRELSSAIHALLAPLQRRTFEGAAPEGARIVDVLSYLLPRPDRAATGSERADA